MSDAAPLLELAAPTADAPPIITLDGDEPRLEQVCQMCCSNPLKRIGDTEFLYCPHCDRGCTRKPCGPCQLAVVPGAFA